MKKCIKKHKNDAANDVDFVFLNNEKLVKCNACAKFVLIREVRNHSKLCDDKKFSCSNCNGKFSTKFTLQRHTIVCSNKHKEFVSNIITNIVDSIEERGKVKGLVSTIITDAERTRKFLLCISYVLVKGQSIIKIMYSGHLQILACTSQRFILFTILTMFHD